MVRLLMIFITLWICGFYTESWASPCDQEMTRLESSLSSQKTLMMQMANANGTAAATIESFQEAFQVKVNAGTKFETKTLSPLRASAKAFAQAGEIQKQIAEKAAQIQARLVGDLKHCLNKSHDSLISAK